MKLNKSHLKRKLVKFNFTTIFFFGLSLISVTFAWFAYSNIVNNDLKVEIKSWNINITQDNTVISNQIGVEISDFYPGSEPFNKTIMINNSGDIGANISYKIKYMRIFDTEYELDDQEGLFNMLSQELPFTINFSVDNDYIGTNQISNFIYSFSWPLDSGNDELDGYWGNLAYNFVNAEKALKDSNPDYEIRNSIDIKIEIVVEQIIDDNHTDNNYLYGNERLLLDNSYTDCDLLSNLCHKYYVLDGGNASDNTVRYMIDPNQNISTISANQISSKITGSVNTLNINDILNIVKTDIIDTNIVINNLSKRVLGSTSEDDYTSILNSIKNSNGEIQFSKNVFYFLNSNDCYWINEPYSSNKTFAIKNNGDVIRLYGENNTTSCKFVSVITKTK